MLLFEITYKRGIFKRGIYRLFAINADHARDLFDLFMPGNTIVSVSVCNG